ncbi:ubiquinone/menaquinone biosynthesis C-methylase UbiE [Cereibacter ovatus]|uniref:Ubiquinone/menaquinone biosynthesis C-methylase UbiE n=1 Tax=Cereibacter ovatus TaxID=439529 RepID=A0A285CX29_9RHOB|nr:class I SAM-dependent methyltransferase [Cereibacter ovatus]SNX71596.1 ubiquinone/menaquinone biosynthesis C-methylase UbiE [Cereibacter ovatus]
MDNNPAQTFWDKVAVRYAARPVRDAAAYEETLADVAARLRPSDRVLEIGCGTGTTATRLGGGVAEWTGADFSPGMVRIAQAKPAPAGVRFILSDADTVFDGSPFDAVCAFHLLHLVPDMRATLAHVHDHLKPGGIFISKTWCFADLGLGMRMLIPVLRAFGLFPPANRLKAADLRQAITAAGFEIEVDRSFGRSPHCPYIVARKAG